MPSVSPSRLSRGGVRRTARAPPFGPEATPLLAPRGLGAQPAFAKQVHGAAVLRAERGGFAGHGDALATARRGLPLVISTADCLPIVLYDARVGRLAAVHAGLRGTVKSVARAAIAGLVAAGGPAPA